MTTLQNSMTLTGFRVLDLGCRPSTAWCSRLLADYGAQVLFAESADGHPLRTHPPFAADGTSVAARYFLSNKTSIRVENSEHAATQADVIITDALPGERDNCADLAALNPRALICAITPYGQDGERATHHGNDLTVNALSGWASVNGLEGRAPLKASGYQASYQAGTFAFGCVLSALIEQLANDAPGQVIDIAELEVSVSTFAPAPLRYQYSGFVWPRKQPLDVNDGPVPVADGYFALTISRPAFWIKAMRILGLPDLADDPDLQQPGLRPKYKERFQDRLKEAMSRWNRMELFEALGSQRVIAGPVLRMDELADNPQLLARGFFRDDPSGKRFPGPFARMGVSGWALTRELCGVADAPAAFESGADVTVYPVRAGDGGGRGPLSGFRGLVLTQAWAGTYATELLHLVGDA